MSIKFEDTKGVIRSRIYRRRADNTMAKENVQKDEQRSIYKVNDFIKVCYGAKTYECTHFTRMILIKFKI